MSGTFVDTFLDLATADPQAITSRELTKESYYWYGEVYSDEVNRLAINSLTDECVDWIYTILKTAARSHRLIFPEMLDAVFHASRNSVMTDDHFKWTVVTPSGSEPDKPEMGYNHYFLLKLASQVLLVQHPLEYASRSFQFTKISGRDEFAIECAYVAYSTELSPKWKASTETVSAFGRFALIKWTRFSTFRSNLRETLKEYGAAHRYFKGNNFKNFDGLLSKHDSFAQDERFIDDLFKAIDQLYRSTSTEFRKVFEKHFFDGKPLPKPSNVPTLEGNRVGNRSFRLFCLLAAPPGSRYRKESKGTPPPPKSTTTARDILNRFLSSGGGAGSAATEPTAGAGRAPEPTDDEGYRL